MSHGGEQVFRDRRRARTRGPAASRTSRDASGSGFGKAAAGHEDEDDRLQHEQQN